ncbi:MAG: hypothetical protein H0X25_22805 [Acidobacteriales bacterium]|nr:hypothetical protein [Terriglobales bacterium]
MKIRTLRFLFSIALLTLAAAGVPERASAQATAPELPAVTFNYDKIGPRQVEDLTSHSVPRDYALAWQSLAKALDTNQPHLLDAYFTGFARDNFTRRITGQKQSGIHVKYTDRGHKLHALFYSPAGDAMQLRDRAQLEMQVMAGDSVIDREDINVEYIVLMTPGADRWLVRDLQAIPEDKH